jgi:hypothetical protein
MVNGNVGGIFREILDACTDESHKKIGR